MNNDHPAPFPLELPKRALETTTADVILDPFMGSGTTGVACAILGRKFIGIELEEKYCEQAVKRIRRAKLDADEMLQFDASQPPLFNTEENAA
jgi:site-specific DNA-methyltransferase (adenine-specific)